MTRASSSALAGELVSATRGRRPLWDNLLGVAATAFSGGQAVALIGSVMLLSDLMEHGARRGLVAAQSLSICGNALRVAGFTVLAFACFGVHSHRPRRLKRGLGIVAVGYGAWCAADGARAIQYARGLYGTAYVGAHLALTTSDLFTCVAVAVVIASISGAAVDGSNEAETARDRRIGWACLALTAGFIFSTISGGSFVVAFSDLGATTRLLIGLGMGAGGSLVAAAGAVMGARAFVPSVQGRSRRDEPWRRNVVAVGTAVMTLGIAVGAVGAVVIASAASTNGFDPQSGAASWLDSIRQVGWAVGAGIVSVALALSGRAENATGTANVGERTRPSAP